MSKEGTHCTFCNVWISLSLEFDVINLQMWPNLIFYCLPVAAKNPFPPPKALRQEVSLTFLSDSEEMAIISYTEFFSFHFFQEQLFLWKKVPLTVPLMLFLRDRWSRQQLLQDFLERRWWLKWLPSSFSLEAIYDFFCFHYSWPLLVFC